MRYGNDEEGIVDIDAPISDYWGDDVYNPYSQKQPSIRSFMTHTSSVMDLETTRGLSNIRNLIGGDSHWRSMEPGDGGYWYYSNFGICVLGTTLELASNQLLDDYFQSHFCEPLESKRHFTAGILMKLNLQRFMNQAVLPEVPPSMRRLPFLQQLAMVLLTIQAA